jgi:hypothetical protein
MHPRLNRGGDTENSKLTATAVVYIKPCTMHIVLIDPFQNVMLVLMHQFHNLDHAHALALNERTPCIATTDVTFTAHALHCVTVTGGHAHNFASTLHVANNKTKNWFQVDTFGVLA